MKGVEIWKPGQLRNVTSLIMPRGESTIMAKLAESNNLISVPLSNKFFFSVFGVQLLRLLPLTGIVISL